MFGVFSKIKGKVLSALGERGLRIMKDFPFIGTAINIYYVVEDVLKHFVIGYIDAGLDAAIGILDASGPDSEPSAIALSVVQIGIDMFYNDINDDPPDATSQEMYNAVALGILKTGGAVDNANELNALYENEQDWLKQLKDYHNYHKVVPENQTNVSDINFNGGTQSWYGRCYHFPVGRIR